MIHWKVVIEELKIWLPITALVALWVVMQWQKKLPSVQGVQNFLDALNTRGGNIIILALASFYFFRHSIYLFYSLFDLERGGVIKQDDAFALMALQFCTASAFGGAFGAMLKTMTGENPKPTPQNKVTDPPVSTSEAAQVKPEGQI